MSCLVQFNGVFNLLSPQCCFIVFFLSPLLVQLSGGYHRPILLHIRSPLNLLESVETKLFTPVGCVCVSITPLSTTNCCIGRQRRCFGLLLGFPVPSGCAAILLQPLVHDCLSVCCCCFLFRCRLVTLCCFFAMCMFPFRHMYVQSASKTSSTEDAVHVLI